MFEPPSPESAPQSGLPVSLPTLSATAVSGEQISTLRPGGGVSTAAGARARVASSIASLPWRLAIGRQLRQEGHWLASGFWRLLLRLLGRGGHRRSNSGRRGQLIMGVVGAGQIADLCSFALFGYSAIRVAVARRFGGFVRGLCNLRRLNQCGMNRSEENFWHRPRSNAEAGRRPDGRRLASAFAGANGERDRGGRRD